MLTQVIKQVNAHVGLVFSPDGNTLYAAGGNDDAVYVYTRSGGSFTAAAPIALGHFAPGATGSARNKGVGLSVQPNASGMDISADGKNAGRRQQLQRLDQRDRYGNRASSDTSTICARSSPTTRARTAPPAAPFRSRLS